MDAIVESPARVAPAEPATFNAKGFRVDGSVSPVEVHVTHIGDNSSLINVGGMNFRTKYRYFVGGHIVAIRFGLAEGAKLGGSLEPVWAGVRGARKILDRTAAAALIEMDCCNTVDIFYPNGAVVQVTMPALELVNELPLQKHTLTPEAALDKRLQFVNSSFEKAGKFDGSERVRKQDRNFHELACLLRLAALFPDLREKVTRAVGHYTALQNGSRLNKGVRGHFRSIMYDIGDRSSYWWLKDAVEQLPEFVQRKRPVERPSPLGRGDKPMTHEERAAYEARRAANRVARNANRPEKGRTSAVDPHSHGGKKSGNNKK